jgi:hypothetical protein
VALAFFLIETQSVHIGKKAFQQYTIYCLWVSMRFYSLKNGKEKVLLQANIANCIIAKNKCLEFVRE